MEKPILAITMGDPAGIGPEIIAKALAPAQHGAAYRPVVIGSAKRLTQACAITQSGCEVRRIDRPGRATSKPGAIDCVDIDAVPPDLPFGRVSKEGGAAAYQFVERAVMLALSGEVDAICTAPLNKEALHLAGHIYPGHTELIAKLCGVGEVSMMLTAPQLRVIHVTTHIGLIDAINRIEPGLVQRTIERAHATLLDYGIAAPRIGVCGINPHAGENGLFGHGEEENKIAPAIRACRARGWHVDGPLPADTLFFLAAKGSYDMVVAMYHDQGHGPVKVLGLDAGVNITVGLPIIRTSVDHGTAFDIAGTGAADERSLLEALRQAALLARRRTAARAAAH